jgi:uncharacterized membrane protein
MMDLLPGPQDAPTVGAGRGDGGRLRPPLRRRLLRHGFTAFVLVSGTFVALPWLAPILMHLGWQRPARVIYLVYSALCHQLPERSFFLFGSQASYSLAEIRAAWRDTLDPWILRQFVGNADMGFKVAWSDRMVSMYTSLPLAALAWRPLRRRIPALPVWGFVLLALPMAVDGITHALSDLAGLGQGFRDSNAWLLTLFGGNLPASFYAGDALGSFNSWMRLLTGALFGLGVVWAVFPRLQAVLTPAGRDLEH